MDFRAAAVLAVILLAGCTDAAPEPEPEVMVERPPPAPLQGWIGDPAARPLAGVVVEIQQTLENTTTDADGHFAFEGAPSEESLVVVARLPGFEVTSKRITLPADTPVVLNFTMAQLPVKVPRVEVLSLSGFLSCQGEVQASTATVPMQCAGEEADDSWDLAVEDDLAGLVVEIAWEQGTPLATGLHATLETLSLGASNQVIANNTGPSVLRLEVAEDILRVLYGDGGLMRLSIAAAVESADLPVGAALHVSQDFEAFVSMFYVDPAPEGYTIQ